MLHDFHDFALACGNVQDLCIRSIVVTLTHANSHTPTHASAIRFHVSQRYDEAACQPDGAIPVSGLPAICEVSI